MELTPRRFADAVVLAPRGRIDHATSEDFKRALWPHVQGCAAGRDRLVLDLSEVDYISSAGLRVLMLAARAVKAHPGALAVAALGPVVREIFDISKFSVVLSVFSTVRDAVGAASPGALAAFDRG